MKTCSKKYTDIAFAHRAHNHEGHCAFIHGHSWAFEFEWAGEPDHRGFIVDFGALSWLRMWIDKTFDHACLFNEADTQAADMVGKYPGLFKARFVKCCSSEGIAEFLFYEVVSEMEARGIRAELVRVRVWEDNRNSATYVNDDAEAFE